MNVEMVYWRDAFFDADPVASEDRCGRPDYIVRTVGWAKEEGRWLHVESERQPDGLKRTVTHIPLENVVRRVRMVEE